jgi:alginate O-acetyltransferase complex protein AlgI
MEFNSFLFLFFLLTVVTLNYVLSSRYRLSLLLFASFVFIGYFSLVSLVAVLFFSIVNFYIAQKISGRPFLYIFALLLNISAIVLFNYFNPSMQGVDFKLSVISFDIGSFIVALGLSFYSLQNIAYVTDIYFERSTPQSSVLKYVLYNSFFPKVVSGPVSLPNELMPQMTGNEPSAEMLASGINRFLMGLLKKMVIADRLFPAVHVIFDTPNNYNGLTTLAGVYLFTIQLYFDFSGYTDMALGAAKMLGYNLKENFNLSLRSTSVTEFWRRWHISLISWFSNYIYYPIVYRFRTYKKTAVFIGIIATFLVSAIWHGIGFTFLLWAFCHIIYMSFELLTKSFRINLSHRASPLFYKLFSIFIVFNAVCFSNIFFRAYSAADAFHLIKNISSDFIPANWLRDFVAPLAQGGNLNELFNWITTIIITLSVLLFERWLTKKASETKINIGCLVVCVLLIMVFGVFSNAERFIYMQF